MDHEADTVVETEDLKVQLNSPLDGNRTITLLRVPDYVEIADELAINADPQFLEVEPGFKKFTFKAENGIAVYEELHINQRLNHVCKLTSWISLV